MGRSAMPVLATGDHWLLAIIGVLNKLASAIYIKYL